MRGGCDGAFSRPHIYFGIVPWGYGWVFPKGDCVCLGVGGLRAKTRNFREPLDALVNVTCIPGTVERLRVLGHRLPFENFGRRPGRGNVLLLGDAAGLVEPLTGEGIASAIESARLAADAIVASLESGRPEAAGRAYCARFRKHFGPPYRYARLARWLFFPEWCLRRAASTLRRRPELIRAFLELLAGRMTYPAYFRRLLFHW